MSTTIDWPSTLPQYVLRDSYSRNPGNNLIRTDMEIGPAKVRRRSTSAPTTVSLSFSFDKDELDDFEEFFITTLGYGVLTFNFPDPENEGSTYEVRFDSSNDPIYNITLEDETTNFIVDFILEKLV